jgi:hypothetical protein
MAGRRCLAGNGAQILGSVFDRDDDAQRNAEQNLAENDRLVLRGTRDGDFHIQGGEFVGVDHDECPFVFVWV